MHYRLHTSRWIVILTATLATAALPSCSTTNLSPITGTSFAPETDEQALWQRAADIDRSVQVAGFVFYNPDLDKYLQSVIDRLRAPLGVGDAPVHAYVLRNPFINAFAMPNGTIYLHTGLLARIDNEAQLATVLAHELAHFSRRHGLSSMRSAANRATASKVVVGIIAVLVAAAARDVQVARMVANLGESASEPLLQAQFNGYSRGLEREADRISFDALVAAGYDPREASKAFAHLDEEAAEAGVEEPYFFGSHPSIAERIANVQASLRDWSPPPDPLRIETDMYRQQMADIALLNIELDLAIGRYRRAEAAAIRACDQQPGQARAHFLLGQCRRRTARSDDAKLAAAAAYAHATELDPRYAEAFRELGLLEHDLGHPQAASAALRRYLELKPGAPERGILETFIGGEKSTAEARP